MTIIIRPAKSHTDFSAVEAIQRLVWGGEGDYIVPANLLLTVQKNDGLVLAAFDTEVDELAGMVGFVFSFIGRTKAGRYKHCSHMLAVLAAYRDQQLGAELKWAQRDYVLAQGIDLMTWTYDPLESRNAHLNINKLGAVCNTFYANLYGDMRDSFNAGMPSDRFQVDWHLASAQLANRHNAAPALVVPAAALLLNPSPTDDPDAPATALQQPTGTQLLIRFPADFQSLKAHRPELARAWKLQLRALCEQCFSTGYTVTGLLRNGAQSLYLLDYHWSPS